MHEPDFEIVRPNLPRGSYKAVLFDFDGTLSLIREGWPRVMVPMMVEALVLTGTGEAQSELDALVEEFVMALNGRPAIYQMARLVEEIQARGGMAEASVFYLREYDTRLLKVVDERVRQIKEGHCPPDRWAVPGSHQLLENLRQRDLKLYLASGTDLRFVRSEADLLNLSSYFGSEINAPDGDDPTFSKRAVIERILAENGIPGEQLLSFGDGVVETQEVRRVGGTAVAVASDVDPGGINKSKRDRLIPVGADIVIPDYRNCTRLVDWLFEEDSPQSHREIQR